MDPIFIAPRYPNDPLPDTMAEFANAVTAEAGGREVLCRAEEPEAPQVSLHELFYVWLPATMSAVEAGKLVAAMGKWLLKRHAEARVKRTRTIVLYDPNGNEVRSISVKRDDNILTEGGVPSLSDLGVSHQSSDSASGVRSLWLQTVSRTGRNVPARRGRPYRYRHADRLRMGHSPSRL